MDVIAGAAFGLEVDSIKDPSDQFYIHGQSMVDCLNSRAPLFSTLCFLMLINHTISVSIYIRVFLFSAPWFLSQISCSKSLHKDWITELLLSILETYFLRFQWSAGYSVLLKHQQ